MIKGLPSLRTLCVLLPVALAACDNERVGGAGDVEGVWALTEEDAGTVFLRVTADSMETFVEDENADCFDRIQYEIIDVNRRQFRIANDTIEFTISMHRDGEELVVTAFGIEQRYAETDVALGTLLVCQPTNPGADCASLPLIALQDSLIGHIEATDAENPDGSHYDLFRIQVGGTSNVRLDMESEQIDSYLVLYDSAGTFIDENDDASGLSLDARLTPQLDPGCYIVMTTTSGPADFGEYGLGFREP